MWRGDNLWNRRMNRSVNSSATLIASLMLLSTFVPMSLRAQVAGSQIQISSADAIGDFQLVESVDLAAVQLSLPPIISVVGADGLGQFELDGLDRQPDISRQTSTTSLQTEGASLVPGYHSVQVTNADAISRFDLTEIEPAPAALSETSSTPATGASISGVRIQVTNADTINRFALTPIELAETGTVGMSTASAGNVAPTAQPIQVTNADAIGNFALQGMDDHLNFGSPGNTGVTGIQPSGIESIGDRARNAADGQLNVRSGAGQRFDIIGQLATNEVVTVLAKSDDAEWLLIMTDNGLTGWVAVQYMTSP